MDLTKNLNQQARIEDITLKEDFGTFVAMQDDDFGDMGSFGMDMDTFMMSDMERGRRFGNSMMVDDTSLNNNNVEPNDLDFLTIGPHQVIQCLQIILVSRMKTKFNLWK